MLKKQNDDDYHLTLERSLDELRRQQPVVISAENGIEFTYIPAETVTDKDLKDLTSASLLLSAPRAAALGIGDTACRLPASSLSAAMLHHAADPTAPQAALPSLTPSPASITDQLAIRLGKLASLLPAFIVIEGSHAPHRVEATRIAHALANPQLELIEAARAQLPLAAAEHTRIVCYRARGGVSVHLALLVGQPEQDTTPLVRIHSSCVTGDILGSLRCDCGDQLKLALSQLAENGCGILIYLHQEGRGIGLINKIRAYALQQQGMDTYDANHQLGFEDDERDFAIAVAMLKKLGVRTIRMLTNNPRKLASVEATGMKVEARVPLKAPRHAHNDAYLTAKVEKSGHWL